MNRQEFLDFTREFYYDKAYGAIERYNEMLVERKRLLRTSTENNPTIVNLDTSIRAMKANVQDKPKLYLYAFS